MALNTILAHTRKTWQTWMQLVCILILAGQPGVGWPGSVTTKRFLPLGYSLNPVGVAWVRWPGSVTSNYPGNLGPISFFSPGT